MIKKNVMTLGYLFAVITVIIWSFENVFLKGIMEEIDPLIGVFFRLLSVVFVSSIFVLFEKRKRYEKLIDYKYYSWSIIMGITSAIYFIGFFYGIANTQATIVSFIDCGLGTFLTIIILAIFNMKERKVFFHSHMMLAGAISLFGVFLLSDISLSKGVVLFDVGVLYITIATTAYAVYTLLFTKINEKISEMRVIRDVSIITLISITILLLFLGKLENILNINLKAILEIFAFTFIVDIVSTITYYKAIRKISGVKSNMLILFAPIGAFVLAGIFLDESINFIQMIGCIMLLLSSGAIILNDIRHEYLDAKNSKLKLEQEELEKLEPVSVEE